MRQIIYRSGFSNWNGMRRQSCVRPFPFIDWTYSGTKLFPPSPQKRRCAARASIYSIEMSAAASDRAPLSIRLTDEARRTAVRYQQCKANAGADIRQPRPVRHSDAATREDAAIPTLKGLLKIGAGVALRRRQTRQRYGHQHPRRGELPGDGRQFCQNGGHAVLGLGRGGHSRTVSGRDYSSRIFLDPGQRRRRRHTDGHAFFVDDRST